MGTEVRERMHLGNHKSEIESLCTRSHIRHLLHISFKPYTPQKVGIIVLI